MRRASTRAEGKSLRKQAEQHNLPGLHVVELDVTDPQSCKACLEHCLSVAGRIDVLINNAGVGGKVTSVEETDVGDFKRIMEVGYSLVLL